MRTETRKELVQYIGPANVNDLRFGEMVLAFFGHLYGKYHYNQQCRTLVRDISVYSSLKGRLRINSPESSTTRYPIMQDYFDNKEESFFHSFRQAIVSALEKNTTMSTEEAKRFVSTKFNDEFFLRYCPRNPVLHKLWNLLPRYIKLLAQKLILRVFDAYISVDENEVISSEDNYDFKIIERLVSGSLHLHESDSVILIHPYMN